MRDGNAAVEEVTVGGPHASGGTRMTRRAAAASSSVCRPGVGGRAPCARRILGDLARRAYRRPADGATSRRCWRSIDAGRAARAVSTPASRRALERLLVVARLPVPHRAGSSRRRARHARIGSAISSWRRGCRSSCGAASRTTSCSTLAERGRARQTRRCSSSRCGGCSPIRAPRALVDNFAGQWLQLRNLASVAPDADAFPGVRREPARRVPARDRAVPRQPAPRRSQRRAIC